MKDYTDKIYEVLPLAQKPGRYAGGEWNSVKKEWSPDRMKFLLFFPDTYEVGMSYLGMKILYGIINARSDSLCERAFSVWGDFERELRKNSIPLFSLESKKPVSDFDIIGISIAYELCASNILTMLDLADVPLRSADRNDSHPIVIAGGPSIYNPEPFSDFIDAFVIGDGEDAINEVADLYKILGSARDRTCVGTKWRKEFLRCLSGIKGIYVPSLYDVSYNDDGTVKLFRAADSLISPIIDKAMVEDLDKAYYPCDQIVPNISVIHDRLAVEVMRGCKHACKFCQASATYRPARERSKEVVMDIIRRGYAGTGYDEVSLLSLSSIDYSGLKSLIHEFNREFCGKSVSLSIPSLRIEDSLKDLPAMISAVKKAGLTFAPEAGSETLRKSLNKNIDIDRLFASVEEAYRRGWKRVKLYFMIGLPGETDDDIAAIADLAIKVSEIKRNIDGRSGQVVASINAFVPKPHTLFQREIMDSIDSLERKKSLLKSLVRSKVIEFDFNDFRRSHIEGAFSRGDRRLGEVIFRAWHKGARFDGWGEHFSFDIWMDAFRESGLDISFYTNRPIPRQEILPWDFIRIRL